MKRITKDTTIGELLQVDPDIAGVLTNIGMHCIGCPSSQMETFEQAAEVHGLVADDLLEDILGFMEAYQKALCAIMRNSQRGQQPDGTARAKQKLCRLIY